MFSNFHRDITFYLTRSSCLTTVDLCISSLLRWRNPFTHRLSFIFTSFQPFICLLRWALWHPFFVCLSAGYISVLSSSPLSFPFSLWGVLFSQTSAFPHVSFFSLVFLFHPSLSFAFPISFPVSLCSLRQFQSLVSLVQSSNHSLCSVTSTYLYPSFLIIRLLFDSIFSSKWIFRMEGNCHFSTCPMSFS